MSEQNFIQDGPHRSSAMQRPVRFRASPGRPGLPGIVSLGLVAAGMGLGWVALGRGNKRRRLEAMERREAREVLVPLLQAEADRDFVLAKAAADAAEGEIMKGRKDWVVGESVYNTKKFVAPYVPPKL